MKKKNRIDVLDMVQNFQANVLQKKPSLKQMYEELRMMRFRIKPVQGDISTFNLQNDQFIETLWSLGKLDEFFQSHVNSLTVSQKHVFYRIFDDIYRKFHNELNGISLKHDGFEEEEVSGLEMEIYKEKPLKIN